MTDVKLWLLTSNTWKHLTLSKKKKKKKKKSSGLFKNVIYKMCLFIVYI